MRPDWSQLSPESSLVKTYWERWEALSMRNGVLYRRWESDAEDEVTWKFVVPKSLSGEVLGQLHNFPTAGYLGIRKTSERVREWYKRSGCTGDVERRSKTCDVCASRKKPNKASRAE